MLVFFTFSMLDTIAVAFLPETKDNSMPDSVEEIQNLFKKEKKPRHRNH